MGRPTDSLVRRQDLLNEAGVIGEIDTKESLKLAKLEDHPEEFRRAYITSKHSKVGLEVAVKVQLQFLQYRRTPPTTRNSTSTSGIGNTVKLIRKRRSTLRKRSSGKLKLMRGRRSRRGRTMPS